MSAFDLKLLAIALMVIDHVGAFLFPELWVLRVVGRLSFPLFAWLIANGARHTSHAGRYLLRLFLFALISQIPFILVHQTETTPFSTLNIFFTLSFGLGLILLLRELHDWSWRILTVLAGAIIAQLIGVEYGAAGVLSIVAFYYTYKMGTVIMLLSQLAIFVVFFTLPMFNALATGKLSSPPLIALWQPVAALSVLFIGKYNGQKGGNLKYFFYLFYPVHLLLIYGAMWWIYYSSL